MMTLRAHGAVGSRAARLWSSARFKFASAVVMVVAALVTPVLASSATTLNPLSPYSASGYDVSYPSAGCTAQPSGYSFAIIGVGGGRPFTANSCLATEWSYAKNNTSTQPSLYFNTGYAGAYSKSITTACANASSNAPPTTGTRHDASVETQAWEIGCSEVDYAQSIAPNKPLMWWADVETGNSWSTQQTYNQYTIDGIAYALAHIASSATAGSSGGFYSTVSSWNKIVGAGFASTPLVTANWMPAASCPTTSGTGFSGGGSVWLAQQASTSYDVDTAC